MFETSNNSFTIRKLKQLVRKGLLIKRISELDILRPGTQFFADLYTVKRKTLNQS